MANFCVCCPRCHGALEAWSQRYECRRCSALYPIIAGIPDFRVYPDPYIGLNADREKGRYLAEEAGRLGFADLVARYYEITPEVTPDQARRFQAHHLAGVTRGKGILERLTAYGLPAPTQGGAPSLDLGCGTGGFLAAASADSTIIGIDIAFRWLVIGKRQLEELGRDHVPLVCACADFMPFPDEYFGLIIAENLIEHTRDAASMLAEVARVRSPRGALMARTVNRYALAPEPHVGLWGVGFLPRRAVNRYVRWRRGIPYEHIRLQSYPGLRRIIRGFGQTDWHVRRPAMTFNDYQHHAPRQQQFFKWYGTLSDRLPPARPALTFFGPYLDIVGRPERSHAVHGEHHSHGASVTASTAHAYLNSSRSRDEVTVWRGSGHDTSGAE